MCGVVRVLYLRAPLLLRTPFDFFGFAGVDELTKVPELETLLCMW